MTTHTSENERGRDWPKEEDRDIWCRQGNRWTLDRDQYVLFCLMEETLLGFEGHEQWNCNNINGHTCHFINYARSNLSTKAREMPIRFRCLDSISIPSLLLLSRIEANCLKTDSIEERNSGFPNNLFLPMSDWINFKWNRHKKKKTCQTPP